MSGGQEIQVSLSAQNIMEAIKHIGDQVINTLERNSNLRISLLGLIFIQDSDRKIWLMGSYDCVIYEKKSTFRQITPIKTLTVLSTPALEVASNLPKSQSSAKNTRSKTFYSVKKCPGDFCEYTLLKDDKLLEKTDSDYDEFISKITLAFYSDNNSLNGRYKQELGSNCLEKEHERLRVGQFTNSIPFRYLLLGKSLILGRERGTNIELTVQEIRKLYEPEYKAQDRPPNPLAHPTRIYDEAKVCENCYGVYNLIRTLKNKQSSVKYLPRINKDVPHYFKINSEAVKAAVGKEEVGMINKGAKSQFSMLYTLTVSEKNQSAEVHEKIVEDIALKMFPVDSMNAWGFKSQQNKNSESWKKYIKTLKQKSVLRNRLKSGNNQ